MNEKIQVLSRESREGNGTPLQYSCLENPMDGGAWWAAVHGVAKNQTRLSDFTFTFHFHALEKEMATHSSVLAWRIPGMGEPRGLPSLGSHRVGHDWSDLAAPAAAKRNHKKEPIRKLKIEKYNIRNFKISLVGSKTEMNIKEIKVSELKDRSIEIILYGQERENRSKQGTES